jgi:myo-inositol 2-dehydrogenase / D-chiro-inositol 1-dehydrogenase
MDVDASVAAAVAARASAQPTSDLDVLLDDPAVDVVAICSPHQFHADQVEAA